MSKFHMLKVNWNFLNCCAHCSKHSMLAHSHTHTHHGEVEIETKMKEPEIISLLLLYAGNFDWNLAHGMLPQWLLGWNGSPQ